MKLHALEAIFAALNAAHVQYLVAGGVAVNAHGYQRLTHDLDLVVALTRSNVMNALDGLATLGYRPMLPVPAEHFADAERRREWIEKRNLEVFSLISDRFPTVTIDLFAREPFDFHTEHAAAMVAPIAPGLDVHFVRLSTLIAMKEATGRARDSDDAEHLRQIEDELSRNAQQ